MKTRRPDGEIFSRLETDIINTIGRRRIKITEIVDIVYEGRPNPSAKQTVASLLNRIEAKCEYYKLDWTLTGEGEGRNGKTVWKTAR